MRVLIADDNDINRQFLRGVLEPEGIEVVEACDGEAAVERFREGVFEVILMDIRMPGMDGLEAARAIRALPAFDPDHTRIIALTADLRLRQKEDLLRHGFQECLAKPTPRATVLRAVVAQPQDRSSGDCGPGPEGDCVDWETALAAAGGNRQLVERLMAMLDLELERFLPVIAEAIEQGDLGEARERVHKIRGSAGYCGARPLQNQAESLEMALSAGDEARIDRSWPAFRDCAERTRVVLKSG